VRLLLYPLRDGAEVEGYQDPKEKEQKNLGDGLEQP
jgi:hypothetical protein